MNEALSTIKDKTLTYQQKLIGLARVAENTINVLKIDDEVQVYREEGIICDLFEGNAPYRPRYIVPNYEKFMEEGSQFLKLQPPTNIWEAVNSLLILYKHVPSITSFPVYIGNIDTLLEPFIKDENEARQAIKLFLTHIDRTLTDSFCHGNIGPHDTKAGRIILEVEKELENAIPNITLKYSDETSDDLAIKAIETALVTAKPSFANHQIFTNDLGNYGIVSCYNGLKIGGGSHTLVRLNLSALAQKAQDEKHFMETILPDAIKRMTRYMDQRVKFLVEESEFFQTSFLVKEGLIDIDNFTAMFGMFGLAEGVNHLLQAKDLKDRFGHGEKANQLGYRIIEKMYELVSQHPAPYCNGADGKYLLHAQVGTDFDHGISPGCRIPIGDEPSIPQHLMQSAKFHEFFPSGIGDIFKFDETAKGNPKYILDIIKGAFNIGMRYFSLYCTDCDVVRITGYLVKRSDMEKLEAGGQVLNDAVVLGLGAVKNQKVLDRKLRKDE
ncbi:YjjI family glycine radical enzyme [Alkaliphilus hydrothermalis]|uniref:YjjI family glycine radical enzyme n=1 Tax=Alkaliphilus hydrothermalis TaxID=1482730 RepID=A0ABS2NRY0_9FIRM|nr:YjjI family glycine radical enzyme [Alkaliphilus hydrothermalis]MBM7615719.1 YjjI family glycine radical enzyme [Alkaliphilus hydrothermalis]